MEIKFWGTRGSIPVPGQKTVKYGGNTPCIQVTDSDGKFVIIDAGTGIRELGKSIIKSDSVKQLDLLISHTHWDHIQGLPFFTPLYSNDYTVNIYSYPKKDIPADEIIQAQWHPVFFPVKKDVLKAQINLKNIVEKESRSFGNLKVETIAVHHSFGTLAFKISEGKSSLIYMTDNEIYFNEKSDTPDVDSVETKNRELIEFCHGVDYLIHDAMYSLKDYKLKKGWGHSNNLSLMHFSMLAEVKNLVLFHYEPEYSDEMIEKLLNETKKMFLERSSRINCIAAKELMEIKF